jgi:AcrR family transcriptional regulator
VVDDIAKQAGVGAGTLYRHFPTRDALIEAIYRSEVEKLAAAEGRFAETLSPVEALRAWMLLFVDYIAAKQIIAPALNSVAGGSSAGIPCTARQGAKEQAAPTQSSSAEDTFQHDVLPAEMEAMIRLVAAGASEPRAATTLSPRWRRLKPLS